MGEVKTYIARFTLRLARPIQIADARLPDLVIRPSGDCLKQVQVRVSPANRLITDLAVEATYAHESLTHCAIAGMTETDGISVVGGSGRLVPPWEIGHFLIRPLLYRIGAVTLQANVFWELEENLSKWVSGFVWTVPDGRTLPSADLGYPGKAILVLANAGERELLLQDWDELRKAFNGVPVPDPPLWKSILAEAHRDRADDLRNVVIHAATALDVGCQRLLPAGVTFSLGVLRGEEVRSPDLRISDPSLYRTLSRLWYTRHGVVHRGERALYDQRPVTGAKPLRLLTSQDVDEFLVAVPKGVAYLEDNPP